MGSHNWVGYVIHIGFTYVSEWVCDAGSKQGLITWCCMIECSLSTVLNAVEELRSIGEYHRSLPGRICERDRREIQTLAPTDCHTYTASCWVCLLQIAWCHDLTITWITTKTHHTVYTTRPRVPDTLLNVLNHQHNDKTYEFTSFYE